MTDHPIVLAPGDTATIKGITALSVKTIGGTVTVTAAVIPPPPTRSVTATITSDIHGGRVILAEQGFTAKARRRDGGTPAVVGDTGWSGLIAGPDPGRDLTYLRPGTTYVVGLQDATQGDWISTTVKIPPLVTPPATTPGGVAAVRAALGQQQNQYRYIASLTQHWNAAGDGTPIPWTWRYNTIVESMSDLTDYLAAVPADGPIPVLRIADAISVIDNGIDDADITAKAKVLQQIAAKQNKRPIVRMFYEWDSNWMRWSIDPTNPGPFLDAVARVVRLVLAQCPSVEFDLCGDLGWGGWVGGLGQHAHNLWDTVATGLAARGVKITYWDTDSYNNGMESVAWLKAELAMVQAFCAKYGFRVAHGEWGISSQALGATGPFNIDTLTYVDAFIDWWTSLPVGMLGHIEIFDIGGDGNFLDGRGGVLVPVEGPKMAARFKQRLAV